MAEAAGQAIVRGASSLNVRSGPGREFPSLDVLKEGYTVEVEAAEGSWVQIRLPNGQSGYVHKAFLVPTEVQQPVPPVATDNEAEVESGAVVSDAGDAGTRPAEPTAGEEATDPDRGSATPAVGDERAEEENLERLVESLQADVKRLLEVQASPVVPEPTPTPVWAGVTAVDATESGSLLGLSIIGLVAGFVLGTIYGRRQERGRRTRVRF